MGTLACTTALTAGRQGASPITPAAASHGVRLHGEGKRPCARAGSRPAFPTAPSASYVMGNYLGNNGPFLPSVPLMPGHARQCSNPACEIPTAASALTSTPGASQRITVWVAASSSPYTGDGHGHHRGTCSPWALGHWTPGKFAVVSEGDRCTDSPG